MELAALSWLASRCLLSSCQCQRSPAGCKFRQYDLFALTQCNELKKKTHPTVPLSCSMQLRKTLPALLTCKQSHSSPDTVLSVPSPKPGNGSTDTKWRQICCVQELSYFFKFQVHIKRTFNTKSVATGI